MTQLAITVYPDKSDYNEMLEYITKAQKAGFNYLYTNSLSIPCNFNKEDTLKMFGPVHSYARYLGMQVYMDVAPRIFEQLNISVNDLSFFEELNVNGLRIDQAFNGQQEAWMTCNSYGIKLEIQMNNNTHMIDTIMDYMPIKSRLSGSHNLYPHPYMGITESYFMQCNNRFLNYGIPIGAYVSSQSDLAFCQWPNTTGGPTLEHHRNMNLILQIKEYIAMQMIDKIIVGNCYVTEDELELIQQLNLDILTLEVELISDISDLDYKIVTEELHFRRGDQNDSFIRSTQSRVKYKNEEFPLYHAPEMIEAGDIIVESSLYGMYAGELQIALKPVRNCGFSNVVGEIAPKELFLLKRIKSWQKFYLTQVSRKGEANGRN